MEPITPQGADTAPPGNMAMNPDIWRYVFDAIEDPAFLHDMQFRILLANRAYCRAAGMTEAQALGKPYWEVFPLGTGPLPGCKDAVGGKGQTSRQEEVNVGAKLFSSQEEVSVGEKLFLSKGYTVRDDQGKQLYALHLLSDTTAQRQAVAALAESEERYRSLVAAMAEGVVLQDATGTIVMFNESAERMLGLTSGQLMGSTSIDPRWRAVHEDGSPFSGDAHPAMVTLGTGVPQFNVIMGVHQPDGVLNWISINTQPLVKPGQTAPEGVVSSFRDITEQKAGEERLRLANTVVENSPAVLFRWRAAEGWPVEYVSRNVRQFGYSAEELLTGTVPYASMVYPKDLELVAAEVARYAASGSERFALEYRLVTKDGAVRWVDDRTTIERDAKGDVMHYQGVLTDVTEKKKAEEALKNMAAKYRTIYESSFDAIMLFDEKGFFDCNPATLRMFGCPARADFIGKHPAQLFPPTQPGGEDSMRLANERSAAAFKNGSNHFEWMHRRLDGTEFPAEVLLTVMQLDGKPVLQATVRDITERKLALEALVRKERYYRKMIEGGTDVFFLIDRAGTLLYRSESGKQLTGWETVDVLGKPATNFVPAESLPLVRNAMAETLAKPAQLTRVEVRMLRKDGTQVETEVLARNLLDDPDVAGIVITARDITKRKQDELALARANRALRTLSACNEALVRAVNESELLDSICRLIVETGGYRMAWVGFPEQDAAKTVRPVAHYGYDEGFLAAANVSWADTELGRGPTGTAMRSGTVQVNQNFLSNPALMPWREAAQTRGYQSSIALPLKSAAATLGVLTIYASEPDAFNETEVTLLQELAADLAFGIETLRTRAERDRVVYEHLHHAEILRQGLEDSIKAIADTVEMRDPYTAGHQRRVGQLAVALAGELGLPEDTVRGIELAASIHDLGKISVPAEILSKPSKLTAIEFMLLKNHAQAGFDILKDIKFPWPIATMVLQHHERLDGSGYPQGLKGEQILLESRIMAVADVVEAMASHRPYRAALGLDSALQEIGRGRGTVYDAAVVDACLRLFAEQRFTFLA